MDVLKTELIDICTRHAQKEGVVQTAVPQIRIVRRSHPTEPLHGIYNPSLFFIVQGAKEVFVGKKRFKYDQSRYLINSVDVPITGRVTCASAEKPYLCVNMSLEANTIYNVLNNIEMSKSEKSITSGIYTGSVVPNLTEMIYRLCRVLDEPSEQEFLASLVIQEIILRLLRSQHGADIRQLGLFKGRTYAISKVIEYIRKNFSRNIAISDLAIIANMSISSLHEHFKKMTAMSPLQYRKLLQLQEARRLLLLENTDAATVAYRVGYESPTQFNREYARCFNAPPKTDVRRLRADKVL